MTYLKQHVASNHYTLARTESGLEFSTKRLQQQFIKGK